MVSLLTGNKFDPNKDVPDLSGKVYIVTGGTAGIGFGITAHLLQHNAAKIFLLSQKEEHADEAMERLKEYGNTDSVQWIQCNLKDLKQTDSVAKQLQGEKQIDALICNADAHMQVNHFSQFHLAMMIWPKLQATPNSRLVLQSSDLHQACPSSTTFTSVEEINTDLGPLKLYGRTKLAQILTVRAMARRMADNQPGFQSAKESGPWVIAVHPGGVSTDQPEQAVEAYGTMGKIGVTAVRPFMKDPEDEGCRPALFAATSEDVVKEKLQGQYIVPDRKVTDPSKMAQDIELGENLWRLSLQILRDKLGDLPYDNQKTR
ncbi:MAG: hypothetical protein Q9224_003015 [Gallowayella concinna]